jgi:hypothetical protein
MVVERGPIEEWVDNRDAGMMHGFTIAEPPTPGFRGNLAIALDIETTLRPAVSVDGRSLVLHGATGTKRMSYSGLVAFDARGRDLAARMQLASGDLVLAVDTTDAVWPITIDPTVAVYDTLYSMPYRATADTLSTTPNADDRLGESVALSGDTLMVGAPGSVTRRGYVYVFVRGASGWEFQQRLQLGLGGGGDTFGSAVAIAGNMAIIGAPGIGRAETFVRSGGTWSNAQLTSATGTNLGRSVAISQFSAFSSRPFVAAIGIPNRNGIGAVLVAAVTSAGSMGVINNAYVEAPTPQSGADFGASVALDGGRLVVGEPLFDGTAGTDCGAVHWYVYNGTGYVHETTIEGSTAGGKFGSAVAISGNVTIVGSPAESASGSGSGAARIYHRAGDGWVLEQQLSGSGVGADHAFGSSVAVDRHLAIVGAPGVNGAATPGAAYVFAATGADWAQVAHVVPATATSVPRSVKRPTSSASPSTSPATTSPSARREPMSTSKRPRRCR